MRVALSSGTVQNGEGRDGIGVYTAALARHLPQIGVDVQGFRFSGPPELTGGALAEQRLDSYLSYVCRDFVGLSKSLPLSADVVHYTDYHIVRSRLPTVATLHDAVPLKYPHWVSPRFRTLKNLIMKRMARHADHVIALSHFSVDELVEFFGVDRDRIHVVPCGIDREWLNPTIPVDSAPVSGTGRQLQDYFLFVGTFQPRKNLDRVLDAYESLSQPLRALHPLVIVGRPGWRCDHTVERIKHLVAQGAPIHWMENVGSRSQLRSLYENALGLVFPTLYEGFGIPVLEAFASNIPVITSTASSLPEVAGDAALLVDPYSTADIAGAMQRLSDDSDLRRQLIAAGRERVEQFTWERTAAMTAAVYAACR